jgi:dTMP kinase
LGAEIRRLLLAGEFVPVAETELLLFLADRAQHVQQVIKPALERGMWVLCDRYSDSTLAYQLAARKLGEAAVNLKEMLAFAECGVTPALTLWFDVPVSEAMKRMQKRVEAGEKSTRLDDEAVSFHQRVATAFADQYQNAPERIQRIDAGLNMDDVEKQVKAVLIQHFQGLTA